MRCSCLRPRSCRSIRRSPLLQRFRWRPRSRRCQRFPRRPRSRRCQRFRRWRRRRRSDRCRLSPRRHHSCRPFLRCRRYLRCPRCLRFRRPHPPCMIPRCRSGRPCTIDCRPRNASRCRPGSRSSTRTASYLRYIRRRSVPTSRQARSSKRCRRFRSSTHPSQDQCSRSRSGRGPKRIDKRPIHTPRPLGRPVDILPGRRRHRRPMRHRAYRGEAFVRNSWQPRRQRLPPVRNATHIRLWDLSA